MQKCLAILGGLLLTLSLNAQLTFVIEDLPPNTPDSSNYFLAGDINDWAAKHQLHQFKRNKQGEYQLTIPHFKKVPFEYKLTRGSWETVEADSIGQYQNNRQYDGKSDTVFLKINTWEDLPVNPKFGWVTVIIDRIPKNTPPDASIYAVGNFNAWHTNEYQYKLRKTENGFFQVKIPLLQDSTLYKFTRGSWETIEGRRNGRARVNRLYIKNSSNLNEIRVAIESWEDLAGNPINSYTLLLLLAAIQGLLLIFAINTLQDNNRAANRVLSILLLILSFALVGRVSTYDRDIFNWLPGLLLLPDFIYFLYAPVFFYLHQ